MNEIHEIMTIPEVSKYLKVSPTTIHRELKNSDLPAFKIGRAWRFSREAIDAWRHEQEKKQGGR